MMHFFLSVYLCFTGEDVVYPPTTESPSSIHTATDVRPQVTVYSMILNPCARSHFQLCLV